MKRNLVAPILAWLWPLIFSRGVHPGQPEPRLRRQHSEIFD